MKKRKIVPSFLTSMNLLCGFLAILVNEPVVSFYLVLVGIAFDFVDGFSARLLKVPSAFGKELDSLADMVSFGVVPGFLFYHHVLKPFTYDTNLFYFSLLIATLIPICAALRLAKFNVKDGGKIGFAGLPSSAAALFIISIPFIFSKMPDDNWVNILKENPIIPLTIAFVFSLLMVTNLPLFNFKSFADGVKKNAIQLTYIICLAILIFLFPYLSWFVIPISILWYLILSVATISVWRRV